MNETFLFCPVCQVPLKAISILPDVHVTQCMSGNYDTSPREECPRGVHCLSSDIFHYRDFRHKLLADYRSSADFVAPDIDIHPSPRKRKATRPPRKQKTPVKFRNSHRVCKSDSDDDEVAIPPKKHCKQLPFNGTKPCENSLNESKKSTSAVSKTNANHVKPNSSKPSEDNITQPEGEVEISQYIRKTNKNYSVSSSNEEIDVMTNEQSYYDEELIPLKKPCKPFPLNATKLDKKTHTETEKTPSVSKVNADKFSKSYKENIIYPEDEIEMSQHNRIKKKTLAILSSDEEIDVMTNETENLVTSNQELVNANGSKAINNGTSVFNPEIPHATEHATKNSPSPLNRNKLECPLENNDSVSKVSENNVSHESLADFDDIIPGAMLDKELLKTLERKKLDSPGTTHETCSTGCGSSVLLSSETELTDTEEENKSVSSSDSVKTQGQRGINSKIVSSSDSDLPLAYLVKKNCVDKENHVVTKIARSKRSLCTPKKKPIHCLSSSSSEKNGQSGVDSDSGKSTGSKDSSTNSIVQGKEVAGKTLRTPKKVPDYLNGQSTKASSSSEVEGLSGIDTDSGKSSGSNFYPSGRDSSTQNSDTALSVECSDNLLSSTSSTTTITSDDYDNPSGDPSFTDGSESLKSITKYKKRKEKRRSPLKPNHVYRSYSEDSSTSDISKKEKLLFGKKKKSSPAKLLTKTVSSADHDDSIYTKSCIEGKKEWQSVLTKMMTSSFPSDLKIDSEDSLTVASSCSSSDTSRSSMTLPMRQCPFYKIIPDTPFAVDAFQYWSISGVKVYFLSHFHSDHYIGLKKSFAKPIYCSQITANLVRLHLRVDEKWLRILHLNEPQVISGVEVTALDANHCPGSMMFLFSLTNGQNYLHVGDFRATRTMTNCPTLQRVIIHKLFLDTTYCSPQYCFPTQEEVIGKVVDIVKERVKMKPDTLVVCGSYTIGKEKVFLGVAEALNWRVWARPNKQRVFACLNDLRINSRLSQDPRKANVHVLPMANIQIMPLMQHLKTCSDTFSQVLAFKPTGWELNGKSQDFKITTRENITIYGVPYSEHSSFSELKDFVQFLEPREIIPTVNVGSANSRNKMRKHFSDWLSPQNNSSNQSTKLQTRLSNYFQAVRAS